MTEITYGQEFTSNGRTFTVTDTAPQIGNLGLAAGTEVKGAGNLWLVTTDPSANAVNLSLIEVGAAADNHGQRIWLEPFKLD